MSAEASGLQERRSFQDFHFEEPLKVLHRTWVMAEPGLKTSPDCPNHSCGHCGVWCIAADQCDSAQRYLEFASLDWIYCLWEVKICWEQFCHSYWEVMKSLRAGADNHHLVQPNPGWDSGVINGAIHSIITESLFFFFFSHTLVKFYCLFASFRKKILFL